jgi:hypothetical protein
MADAHLRTLNARIHSARSRGEHSSTSWRGQQQPGATGGGEAACALGSRAHDAVGERPDLVLGRHGRPPDTDGCSSEGIPVDYIGWAA